MPVIWSSIARDRRWQKRHLGNPEELQKNTKFSHFYVDFDIFKHFYVCPGLQNTEIQPLRSIKGLQFFKIRMGDGQKVYSNTGPDMG